MDISDVESDETSSSSTGEDEVPSPWKVSVSEYEGSLQDAISRLDNEENTKNEGWLTIAREIEKIGVMRLQRAMELYGEVVGSAPSNSTYFSDRLLKHLPVQMFSISRKEGWFVAERTQDTYSLLVRLFRHSSSTSSQLPTDRTSLTYEDYSKFESILTSEQKIVARWVLSKVYGVTEAQRRFHLYNLKQVNDKVEAAQEVFDVEDNKGASHSKSQSKAQKKLEHKAKGGRVAWEKDAVSVAIVKETVEKVCAVDLCR
jgi:hypothetical protein